MALNHVQRVFFGQALPMQTALDGFALLMQQQGWKAGNSASSNIITYPAKSQVLFVSDY